MAPDGSRLLTLHVSSVLMAPEPLGDSAVGTPFHQQAQHLNLTGGEAGQGPIDRYASAKVEAAPAGQGLQCGLQRRRPELGRGLVSRTQGCGGLLAVARAKQCLGQPPLAASHRVHMAVGEGVNRGAASMAAASGDGNGPAACTDPLLAGGATYALTGRSTSRHQRRVACWRRRRGDRTLPTSPS
jgi:hypothetical protein